MSKKIGWAEPTNKPCYLRVRNFEKHQSEKMKAQPLWIQLWTNMLTNYDFQQLPDATKWHFVGLLLLAAQTGNRFPNNPAWLAQKIGALEPIDLDLLLSSHHLEACKRNLDSNSRYLKEAKPLITKGEAQNKSKNGKKQSASTDQNRSEESRSEQTKAHTDTEQKPESETNESGVSGVCVSKFSLPEILRYVERCRAKGQAIGSPEGLAIKLHRTGEADALIEAALFPEQFEANEAAKYGTPREFTDDVCSHCFGIKTEVIEGKGARPCAHCIDERGRRTGKEPKQEVAA